MYLSPKEIAKHLNISESLVYKLLKSDVIRGVRIGERLYRISEIELENFIRSGFITKEMEEF